MFGLLVLLMVLGGALWFGFALLHLMFKLVFGFFGLLVGGAVTLAVGGAALLGMSLLGLVLLPIAGLLLLPLALPILFLIVLVRLLTPRPRPLIIRGY